MLEIFKSWDWPALCGGFLFIGMMCYYYNLTFVQLGLEDFGSRILGLSQQAMAADIAVLALLTCFVAVGSVFWMQKHSWGKRFMQKLRLSFLVVLAQTFLRLICPLVQNEAGSLVWLSLTLLTFGVGVPVMFFITVDLLSVWMHGEAAISISSLRSCVSNCIVLLAER